MNESRIFLCHASEDKARVQELYSKLKQVGYHPWLDKEDLLPGQDWWEEIERIIRDRNNLVVVCLSCHSAKKGVVQKEIKWALGVLDEMPEDTIYLIPTRLELCEVPRRLSKLHWVDLFEPDGFENLKKALDFEIGKRQAPFEPELVLIPTICNPFIVGGAVPPERFIGRRREINAIVAQLTGPALGSVAVHGDSRMGKTSLLDFLSSPRLARELPGEAFTLVRIDCASIEPFSIPLFWQTAKRELASQITSKSMSGLVEHWQDDWGTMSTSEVQQIFHDLQRAGHHPILMLDEFDSLISHARKAEDGARLLRTLRSLIGNRLIALVIATFRPLEEAIQGVKLEGQPFPSSFMPLGLTVFERSECDELIEAALRGSPIKFDEDDRDYVYEVSTGYPYWLQFASFRLLQEKLLLTTQ